MAVTAMPVRVGLHRKMFAGWMFAASLCLAGSAAHAEAPHTAPGFDALPKDAKVVVMPVDIELFSISAGGIPEPKADWTEAATRYFRRALDDKRSALGLAGAKLKDSDADTLNEVNTLHAAVASAIAMHHFGPSSLNLPTKEGRLDWSLGDAVASIREKTGADFAIFSWVRDSYASNERKAAMVALALIGIGVTGGIQTGYASLVDLKTGRVVWFNRLARARGDLREAEKARETVDALLDKFPVAK